MPDLFFERHVPHLPQRMFDLVSDLEDYPRFLPNVRDMQVKRDDGARGDVRYARMTLKFGPVTQAYTSRVEADAGCSAPNPGQDRRDPRPCEQLSGGHHAAHSGRRECLPAELLARLL